VTTVVRYFVGSISSGLFLHLYDFATLWHLGGGWLMCKKCCLLGDCT